MPCVLTVKMDLTSAGCFSGFTSGEGEGEGEVDDGAVDTQILDRLLQVSQ